ncbi:MAG: T9SS type A sorting domain-containing protein [Bacteroidota bacterium]
MDLNGRMLLKSHSTDRIDVSALQRGVYLLRFTVGSEVITRRFIKE